MSYLSWKELAFLEFLYSTSSVFCRRSNAYEHQVSILRAQQQLKRALLVHLATGHGDIAVFTL
jgi:hypothetical protein